MARKTYTPQQKEAARAARAAQEVGRAQALHAAHDAATHSL